MKSRRVLLNLADKGIRVHYESGKLKFYGELSCLSDAEREEIVSLRQEIIDYLKTYSGSTLNITRLNMDVVTTSFAQQRLWFIDSLQEGSPEYNMPMAFEVFGDLDLSLVTQVFTTILERHEILRTVYVQEDDKVLQRIRCQSEIDFTITIEDVSHLTGEAQITEVKRLVGLDMTTVFDLSSDLMLRVSYVKTGFEAGVLLFNMHHIASDGWSMEILSKEFFALYDAYSKGQANPLPALSIQYADYAYWQRESLAGDMLDTQLAYWEKQLDELPAVHNLPLDKPRPEVQYHDGGIVCAKLSAKLAQELLDIAKLHQLTPFMLLHGALSLVLSRHSNSVDIVIGTPIANRLQAELEPLIGFFVNTLVLRINTRHSSLAEFFAHIKQVHQDAQSNQNVPFEQLVERLNVPRSTAYTPIFQIMLTMDTDYGLTSKEESQRFTLPGISLRPVQSELIASKFDLDISISINEQGIALGWVYDTSLFTKKHIEQLNDHFCRLLHSLVGNGVNGDYTLPVLTMLSDTEVQRLVHDLNDTVKAYPQNHCIHEIFEQQALENPNHVAVVCGDKQLTYKVLNERANQLAHYLREQHSLEADALVGLCVERSLEMVIGILGIFKAGAAYVSLDPNIPAARLQYLVEDTQLSVILTTNSVVSVLNFSSVAKLLLDDENLNADLHNYPVDNLSVQAVGVNSRHLAYIIYTSGSTGQPKGVMIEHLACLNHCFAMIERLELTAADVIGQTAPLSFDISVWQIITMLLVGGQTCIVSDEIVKSPQDLLHTVAKRSISLLQIVPSLMNLVLDECEDDRVLLASLRWLLVTGETCSRALQERWQSSCPDIPLMNAYGPAECADDVSLYTVGENKTLSDLAIFERRESEVRYYCREFPALFRRAQGSELFDCTGQRYLDFVCGAGSLNYGHNNPRFKAALLSYIEKDGITHSLDYNTEAKAQFLLAFEQSILEPRGLDYKLMFPGPTGTNAVEAALKLARKVTGRQNILHCEKSFHGMTMGALSVSGDESFKARAGIPLGYSQSMPFVSIQDSVEQDVETVLQQYVQNPQEKPAAIILEVVQGEGGVNVANEAWLKGVAQFARRHDILLIVDDVQVGCGRTGKFFSFEHYGIQPDLVCLSKSIGGYGLPMALLLIRPDYDIWNAAEHNGTFRGNNHAFVTATAALNVYWRDGEFEKEIQAKSDMLSEGLKGLIEKYPGLNGRHKGLGLMQGVVCFPAELATKVRQRAFANKLMIETGGKNDEVIKLLPALTTTVEELQEGLRLLDKAIAEVLHVPALGEIPESASMPIGSPIGNMRLYVVDSQDNLLPFGVTGELCVAGVGLARGYFNHPELTGEKFVIMDFAGVSEKVYKTGDMVRYLADGNLEFVGRLDDQVKIRGFRIELGEVEYQLCQQRGVDSGLVVVKEVAGSEQLVAYVKAGVGYASGDGDYFKDIKEGLKAKLPGHMVPGIFIGIETWPLTANGKIDRIALPEPDNSALQGEYVEPKEGVEQQLAQIWSELLKLDIKNISASANFFELGGHSLLVMSMISKIRQEFSQNIKLDKVFAQPTITELAKIIEQTVIMNQIKILKEEKKILSEGVL